MIKLSQLTTLLLTTLLVVNIVYAEEQTELEISPLPKKDINTSPNNLTKFTENNGVYKQTKLQMKSSSGSEKNYGEIFTGKYKQNSWLLNKEDYLKPQVQENIIGGSTTYQYGRFSAETGLLNTTSDSQDSKEFYLQSTYAVVDKEKLNISVLAKIEASEKPLTNYYFKEQAPSYRSPTAEQLKNTVGFIGSYSLTPQWAIVGAITSSQSNIQPINEEDKSISHSALIGTTYSF